MKMVSGVFREISEVSVVQEMRDALKRNQDLLSKRSIFNYRKSVANGVNSRFMREAIRRKDMSPQEWEAFRIRLAEDRKRTDILRRVIIASSIVLAILVLLFMNGFFGSLVNKKMVNEPSRFSERQWLSMGKDYQSKGILDTAMFCYYNVLELNPKHLDAHIYITQIYVYACSDDHAFCDSAKVHLTQLKNLGFVDPRIEEFENKLKVQMNNGN